MDSSSEDVQDQSDDCRELQPSDMSHKGEVNKHSNYHPKYTTSNSQPDTPKQGSHESPEAKSAAKTLSSSFGASKGKESQADPIIPQESSVLQMLCVQDPTAMYRFAEKLALTHQYRPGPTTSTTDHYNPELPGTIYGMSILHRSHLSAPIWNLRLRGKHANNLYALFHRYGKRELSKSGAPKTAWDYAHVLLGCQRDLKSAYLRVEELWGPVVTKERKVVASKPLPPPTPNPLPRYVETASYKAAMERYRKY
ncbi:hypothetical protein F4818DRAFT_441526 [Hypoxylon cercidicola]|nr:hypothetical protein F4818DRAFT_441526 [Hypoxylon cercidicola]